MIKKFILIHLLWCFYPLSLHAEEISKEEACENFRSVAEHFALEQQNGVKKQTQLKSIQDNEKITQDVKTAMIEMLDFIYTNIKIEKTQENKALTTSILSQRAYDQCIEKN